MRVKSRLMIAAVIIAAVFAVSGALVPGVAQDQTEQRVSGLETRVAALEAAVVGSPVASPVVPAKLVATPASSPVVSPAPSAPAGADALWQGTYVAKLPTCDSGGVCLAALNQNERSDEYYDGVIHNNTADTVFVQKVAVTLRDAAGGVAADGDSLSIAPPFIAPGGHALVLLTIDGERDPSFTWGATVDHQVGAAPSGNGTPIRIDIASVRGDAIVGELTNTSGETFNGLDVTGMCFSTNGAITYRGSDDAATVPYAPGASDTFSIPIYSADCTNFVVVGTGNPY